MEQQALIDRIVAALGAADAQPRALFLSGSLGAGRGDAYSDVDLLAIVGEGETAAFIDTWRSVMDQTLPVALWYNVPFNPAIVNLITDDWDRVDIHVLDSPRRAGMTRGRLRPLIDPENLHIDFPDTVTAQAEGRVEALIVEFIRVLGLTPIGLGRNELEVALTGVGLQRNALAELMRIDSGVVGGMLSWRKQISADHYALLQSLPTARADRESIVAANKAIAQAFIPLARRMAAERGIEWPERFWQATRRRLESEIGMSLDM